MTRNKGNTSHASYTRRKYKVFGVVLIVTMRENFVLETAVDEDVCGVTNKGFAFITLFMVIAILALSVGGGVYVMKSGVDELRIEQTTIPKEEIKTKVDIEENVVIENDQTGENGEPEIQIPEIKEEVDTKVEVSVDLTPIKDEITQTQTQSSAFVCENDPTVSSRAFVLLLGFDDQNREDALGWIEGQIGDDPKNRGVLVFTHNGNDSLASISNDFVASFNEFVAEAMPEEVVIIGWSAGGTIAASTAHRLSVSGKVELHTVASPLRGYSLKGFLEGLLEDLTGFEREIGVGFDPFARAPSNFSVYHHKTVTDSDLSGRCGSFASFCDPKAIQANNLPNSKEFYYPEYDHEPLMHAVAEMVINCRKN